MNTPRNSQLGHKVTYPTRYDPALLFPIPRAAGRAELGIGCALPFSGHDRWQAYELSWLDARGKPRVATATVIVPCTSPNLIESKSLKLYLNSLNSHRFVDDATALRTIARDLSRVAGAQIDVSAGLPLVDHDAGAVELDALDFEVACYGPPDPNLLHSGRDWAQETLLSHLLKSNCPVTGQPDWASVRIAYRGQQIDHASLLRYLVSLRDHAEFHEQCVERIFIDVFTRCAPERLSVEARYTRRGGLDINPWRATADSPVPVAGRDLRQ